MIEAFSIIAETIGWIFLGTLIIANLLLWGGAIVHAWHHPQTTS